MINTQSAELLSDKIKSSADRLVHIKIGILGKPSAENQALLAFSKGPVAGIEFIVGPVVYRIVGLSGDTVVNRILSADPGDWRDSFPVTATPCRFSHSNRSSSKRTLL